MIETARLTIEPASAAALDAMLDSDRATLERLTGARFPDPLEPPPENADALAMFRDRLRDDPSIAPWWFHWVVLRSPRTVVGSAGFTGPPSVDGVITVGYAIYPAVQGRGFAGEAVTALVEHALARGARRVRATIAPGNVASQRVAARAGLVRVGAAQDGEVGSIEVWERGGG